MTDWLEYNDFIVYSFSVSFWVRRYLAILAVGFLASVSWAAESASESVTRSCALKGIGTVNVIYEVPPKEPARLVILKGQKPLIVQPFNQLDDNPLVTAEGDGFFIFSKDMILSCNDHQIHLQYGVPFRTGTGEATFDVVGQSLKLSQYRYDPGDAFGQ